LATERVERRLAAILAADVAGYSRLTGMDEEGTHTQLQEHLRCLFEPKIAAQTGRTSDKGFLSNANRTGPSFVGTVEPDS
jgi:class 3 adenylate cyclase